MFTIYWLQARMLCVRANLCAGASRHRFLVKPCAGLEASMAVGDQEPGIAACRALVAAIHSGLLNIGEPGWIWTFSGYFP